MEQTYYSSNNDQLIVLQFINCNSILKLWPADFSPAYIFWSNTHQKSLINSMIKTFYTYFNISNETVELTDQFIIENMRITSNNLNTLFNILINTVLRGAIFSRNIKRVTTDNIDEYKLIAYMTDLK